MRIAALRYIADAGFGIAMPITLAHLARTGELPMTPFGFRAEVVTWPQAATSAAIAARELSRFTCAVRILIDGRGLER